MKKLLLILLIAATSYTAIAQRTAGLQYKTTVDSSLIFIVDSAKWTDYKKVKLSAITSLEAAQRVIYDDSLRLNTGLNSNFDYVPDSTSNYLKTADFAAYGLGQNIVNSIKILDDTTYYFWTNKNIWESGSGSTSAQLTGGSDTAVGDYSVAVNRYNIALSNQSFAQGKYSLAPYEGSRSIASGRNHAKYGSTQTVEVVGYASDSGTGDTVKIAGTTFPILTTDVVVSVEVDIVGVQSRSFSSAGTVGDAISQRWNFCARNDAGTSSLIGTTDSTTAKRSAGATQTMSVSVSDATEAIHIIITGVTNESWYYTAYIRMTMIGYRNFSYGY